ncbi:DUF3078 domain-containing protein, partial [uncultured Duncaniella sp.]
MFRTFLSGLFLTVLSLVSGFGQTASVFGAPFTRSEIYNYQFPSNLITDSLELLSPADGKMPVMSALPADSLVADSLRFGPLPIDSLLNTMYVPTTPLPSYYFRPVVFDSYQLLDTIRIADAGGDVALTDPVYGWLATDFYHNNLIRRAKQSFIVNLPADVRFDEASLPEPPKKFEATVDPNTAKIVIAELPVKEAPKKQMEATFGRRYWLRTFNSSVQFSQAFVSPNWYQGGNNNINVLVNLFYNVKLNPAFHKKLLFETTFQYKLGMNDAPNDSLRNYSISEDLFQFNLLAGYKASKYWYYSTNVS